LSCQRMCTCRSSSRSIRIRSTTMRSSKSLRICYGDFLLFFFLGYCFLTQVVLLFGLTSFFFNTSFDTRPIFSG
jgi:hypothetical protein